MYWVFVFGSIFAICGVNMASNFSWQTVQDLFLVFVVILLPSILSLFIKKVLPEKFFDGTMEFFLPKKYEKSLFNKINIRSWKDKIPNWGNVGKDMAKDGQIDVESIKNFIVQTCLGEIVHLFCMLSAMVSGVVLALNRPDLIFTMILPVVVVYAVINLLSVLIQRYNRPRLQILLNRLERKNRDSEQEEYQKNKATI